MLILRLTLLAVVCGCPATILSETTGKDLAPKGANADWLPADKTGFGTSYTTDSNVWFTLENGRLSEVYYPRVDTPSVRNLDFIVTDGKTFATRAQDASTSLTRLINPGRPGDHHQPGSDTAAESSGSLTYQIVNLDRAGRWRLTTTFVTDPARPTLLIDIEFTSLNGKPYQLYAVYQPQLTTHGWQHLSMSRVKLKAKRWSLLIKSRRWSAH